MARPCPSHRRLGVLILTLVALVVAACGQEEPRSAGGSAVVRGDPPAAPELRKLEAQANELLDGGTEAFEARLEELKGHPIVVNQWASWCAPCRYEFPFFQRQAAKHRGRVAFLGVDSGDSRDDAKEFLAEFPVPFPHYFDPDAEVARVFKGGRAWPTTAFYNSDGELTKTHQGAYATEAKLEEDIEAFALGG